MKFCLFAFLLLCLSPSLHAKESQSTILLITSTELKPSWAPFAEWKTKQEKPTKVLDLADIDKAYPGRDIQEKIRLCVRDHVDHQGTKWVILGGDSSPSGGIVPDRDTHHKTMWGTVKDIPTDIYYLAKGSWDADKDGIYGEFGDDRAEIDYPDGSIGLGRIPVRTAAQVAAYTAKVVAYESRYPAGEFGNTMTYTCTVAGAVPKVKRSWDDYVCKALPKGRLFRYFGALDQEKSDPHYDLDPGNWVKMINNAHSGKYHFHGHGLNECWVLDRHTTFTHKHIKELNNKDSYPVITTVSCFTGQFDSDQDPSIAEAMLRVENAGAIAIVAPCREGKPHFMDPERDFPLMVKEGKLDGTTLTMSRFWQLGISQSLSTGEALMLAKADMLQEAATSPNFHLCLSELNLLGDPSLAVHPSLKGDQEKP